MGVSYDQERHAEASGGGLQGWLREVSALELSAKRAIYILHPPVWVRGSQ